MTRTSQTAWRPSRARRAGETSGPGPCRPSRLLGPLYRLPGGLADRAVIDGHPQPVAVPAWGEWPGDVVGDG